MPPELRKRIITALFFALIVLSLIFYNENTRFVFLIVLGILCLYEYFNIVYTKKSSAKSVLIIIGTALMILSVLIQIPESIRLILLALSIIISLLLVRNLFYPFPKLHTKLAPLTAFFYLVLPVFLAIQYAEVINLKVLLLTLLLLIWTSDIAAYFVGTSMGKRKLFERLSPNKTKEGFYGAGMTTLLISFILSSYFQLYTLHFWLMSGLFIWLFGSLGDLFESQIKRQFGIKDSGNILPGHGGFLDRFDGFIFAIPFVLLVIEIFERL